MARVLALSGTPGVGKTALATALATTMRVEIISLGEFVISRKLYDAWDSERSTHIVDEDKTRVALLSDVEQARGRSDIEWLIIEGLMADVIADVCDLAIVLRLDPRIVKTRLEQRDYAPQKVAENIQAELLGTCSYHMQEARGKDFLDLDTTNKGVHEVATIVASIMQGSGDKTAYKPGLVDWISRPDIDPAKFF